MESTTNVPKELQEVCEELMKNWKPPVHMSIQPVRREHDFGHNFAIRITVRDFVFDFPWAEVVTLQLVHDIYGFLFRATCYAIEDAILKGVNVGVELRQTALIKSIGHLVDIESERLVTAYRHNIVR